MSRSGLFRSSDGSGPVPFLLLILLMSSLTSHSSFFYIYYSTGDIVYLCFLYFHMRLRNKLK